LKRSTLQVAIVKRHRNSKGRLCWMLQDVMTPRYVMNEEPCAPKRSD